MRKMDGRDSAEYQILENRDIIGILGIFKSLEDKRSIGLVFFKKEKGEKRERKGGGLHRKLDPIFFRER